MFSVKYHIKPNIVFSTSAVNLKSNRVCPSASDNSAHFQRKEAVRSEVCKVREALRTQSEQGRTLFGESSILCKCSAIS